MARPGIDPKLIGQQNESALGVLKREYDALGEVLSRRAHRDRQDQGEGRGVRARGPELGRRHGRHPLRPLSRNRRAAQHPRQAGRLHRHPAADRRHPARLAAHPVGPPRRSGGARRLCGDARPRLRRDELQHLPGRRRPAAILQVRQPLPHRPGGQEAGDRAQHRLHHFRQGGRLQGADHLDRRRLEFSRPEPLHEGVRALSGIAQGDLRGAADRLAAVHRAQALRAGLLFNRRAGLGHQLPDRQHARRARLLPGRSRPSCAEHQHRDDRRAADPVQEARRLPFQRLRNTATTISIPAPSIPTSCS